MIILGLIVQRYNNVKKTQAKKTQKNIKSKSPAFKSLIVWIYQQNIA